MVELVGNPIKFEAAEVATIGVTVVVDPSFKLFRFFRNSVIETGVVDVDRSVDDLPLVVAGALVVFCVADRIRLSPSDFTTELVCPPGIKVLLVPAFATRIFLRFTIREPFRTIVFCVFGGETKGWSGATVVEVGSFLAGTRVARSTSVALVEELTNLELTSTRRLVAVAFGRCTRCLLGSGGTLVVVICRTRLWRGVLSENCSKLTRSSELDSGLKLYLARPRCWACKVIIQTKFILK